LSDSENNDAGREGLLVYILDKTEDKQKAIEYIAKELNVNTFTVGLDPQKQQLQSGSSTYPPVYEWLRGFRNAKYVITDSFHGCAFAILFNKPFIVYGNDSRGMTRFDSILDTFNLSSRLIKASEDLKKISFTDSLDSMVISSVIRRNKEDVDLFFETIGL
jgi:exopolysaccharide biosynthesis predicted pyruvyltransferase EpsI